MDKASQRKARDEKAVAYIEQALKEGGTPPFMANRTMPSAINMGAKMALADGFVKSVAAFRSIFQRMRDDGTEPDWDLYRPAQYVPSLPPETPEIERNSYRQITKPDADLKRVLAIGDAHDSPEITDKSRFKWLGRLAADRGYSHIVQIGDWLTLDSLSTHDKPGTLRHAQKPTFQEDLDSFHASQKAFQIGLAGHKPKKDFIEGNHEWRASRFENETPAMHGLCHHAIQEAFAQWGWRYTPFAEFRFINGVGYIHAPINGLGKPMGGKTAMQRAANESTFDFVCGHTHNFNVYEAAKLGGQGVTAINLGCALPWGFIEPYAKHSTSNWWWGAVEIATVNGRVIGTKQFSMLELEDRYGD